MIISKLVKSLRTTKSNKNNLEIYFILVSTGYVIPSQYDFLWYDRKRLFKYGNLMACDNLIPKVPLGLFHKILFNKKSSKSS